MRLRTLLLTVAISTLCLSTTAFATVPTSMNVQGRLTDSLGTPAPQIDHFFRFSIYDDSLGGTRIWPSALFEEQTIRPDVNGLWNAHVGAVDPLSDSVFSAPVRWLEIEAQLGIKSNAATILPRVRLVTGPFAYRVATVDGATGGWIKTKVKIGPGNTNTGSNAFVAGADNSATGMDAVISGGSENFATGELTAIGGGNLHSASGRNATIAGGEENQAGGDNASVGGGYSNSAGGIYSTVAGGYDNSADGDSSFVGGGANNVALENSSTVGGGTSNTTSNLWGTIGGGHQNTATGGFTTIAGGYSNLAVSQGSTVAGGEFNSAVGYRSTVGGGVYNSARGFYSVVSGGGGPLPEDSNTAIGFASTISGGRRNVAEGLHSTISGGNGNTASGESSTVGGGAGNHASGDFSGVGGGANNRAIGERSTIGGGRLNRAYGRYSVVAGGGGFYLSDSNAATGEAAVIPGGRRNIAAGEFSFAAGLRAQANHDGCFVWADSTDADFASTNVDQFLIRAAGGVGINTNSPNYTLDVDGSIGGTGGLYHASDRRYKRNVQSITGALDKIEHLRGVTFDWRTEEYSEENFPEDEQIGLIAQEVEDVVPQLVATASDGYKSVDYARLVAVLIEAVKELSEQNAAQTLEIEKLKSAIQP